MQKLNHIEALILHWLTLRKDPERTRALACP
jgi:hypothetical protein